MIGDPPSAGQVAAKEQGTPKISGATVTGYVLGRKGMEEAVPALFIKGKAFKGRVVVWIDPAGKSSVAEKGKLVPAAQAILDQGAAILAVDVFHTGELKLAKVPAIDKRMGGYTWGYNPPILARRVHDILTAVVHAGEIKGAKSVALVGWGKAGPWALLARALCDKQVRRTAADVNKFRFDGVREMSDEMMLPGVLKYGGLGALAALAAPGELLVHNHSGTGTGKWLKTVYAALGAEKKLTRSSDKMDAKKVVEWLEK